MKKTNLFKTFLLCFLLVFVVSGCNNGGNPDVIKSIEIVDSSIPEVIYTDEVGAKLAELQIEVTRGNGETETININKNMIKELSTLTKVGEHTVTIEYEGVTTQVTLIIETRPIVTVEVTYTLEVIQNNLKGSTSLPESYDLYVWSWIEGITDEGGAFFPAGDGKFEVPEEYNGVVFVIMPVGAEPSWDTKLDQSYDLEIFEGAVREIGGTTEIIKATFTIEENQIIDNLLNDALVPEEGTYDLYVYVWGGKRGDQWILVENGTFEADETITGCCFVYITKDYNASWTDMICQSADFVASVTDGVGTLTLA